MWSVNKIVTLNAIHEELERRDTWQGKAYLEKSVLRSHEIGD